MWKYADSGTKQETVPGRGREVNPSEQVEPAGGGRQGGGGGIGGRGESGLLLMLS